MVSAGNNYFSVFVNNTLEIFESEYVSINNTSFDALNYSDNKTVKYFYYLKSSDKADEILVSPDETKGIKAVKIGVDGTPTDEADTEDIIYKIYQYNGKYYNPYYYSYILFFFFHIAPINLLYIIFLLRYLFFRIHCNLHLSRSI